MVRIDEKKKGEGHKEGAGSPPAAAAAAAADAIIDAMGDGVLLIGLDGKVNGVNPAYAKLLGISRDEIVGKDSADLVQKFIKPEDIEKAMTVLGDTLEGKIPKSEIITSVSKDGRETPLSFTASVVKDAEGNLVNILFTMRDITELKRKTDDLEKSKKELADKLEELEKFSKVSVGRELKMVELKKRVKELEEELAKKR